MKLLLLASLAILSVYANPGFRIVVTDKGLDYAKDVGLTILREKLQDIHIPDVNGKKMRTTKSLFSYDLTNIKIASLSIPSNLATITPIPNQGVTLAASSVAAGVTANYKITVGSGWFSVSKSGSITATASQASFSQAAGIATANGYPDVNAGANSVSIGKLDIAFHGDVIDDILNLFESDIADYVKGQLNSVIQEQLISLINGDLNDELRKIPLDISIYDGFGLDYTFLDNPIFTSNMIQADCKGQVYYGSTATATSIVAPPLTSIDNMDNSHMVYFDGTEFVLNTMGEAATKSGLLEYTLTKDLLNGFQAGAGSYLDTTCPGSECVGSVVAGVGTNFPNGTTEVYMQSTTNPSATIDADGAHLNFVGTLDFKARTASGLHECFTATVDLSVILVQLTVSNDPNGYIISGGTHTTGAQLQVTSSAVGTVSNADLNQVWQMACLGIIDGMLNGMTTKGIQIPNIPYFDIVNPIITTAKDNVIVAADISYQGGIKLH